MANNPVYVYTRNNNDFTTTGLVGDLKPISAIFNEERNGICQLTLRLSYDEYEKWKQVGVGRIIKCKVPVRTPPVIQNDQYANTTTKYSW